MSTRMHHTPTHQTKLAEERGQSMVEFALVMPFLVFLLLGICQFGLAFHNYLSITDAARVGAREAAVSRTAAGGPCQAARDAIQATVSPTQWATIADRITCTAPGDMGSSFTLSISYPFAIGLPGVFGTDPFQYSGDLATSATERLE
jgi:Flp pilus assembly protein TadG